VQEVHEVTNEVRCDIPLSEPRRIVFICCFYFCQNQLSFQTLVNLFDFVSRIFIVWHCIDMNALMCSCVSAHTHTYIQLKINHFKKKDFSKSNYLCQ